MMTMTKAEALKIQAEQVANYSARYPNAAEIVAAATDADKLQDGFRYDVVIVNRYIPRGGAIETLLGIESY